MADIDSIANAIAAKVGAFLSANSFEATGGRPVRIRRGILTQGDLRGECSILANDLVLVEEVKGAYRTMPWPMAGQYSLVSSTPCTITGSVAAGDITFTVSGIASGVVMVALPLNGRQEACAGYAATAADTAATIASALAGQIKGATADGPVLTIPKGYLPVVRTSGYMAYRTTLRRQIQMFNVSVWSGDPDKGRAVVAGAIDAAIADNPDIIASDGSYAQMVFAGAVTNNASASVGIFGRDMSYNVRFDTTKTIRVVDALAVDLALTSVASPEVIEIGGIPVDRTILSEADDIVYVTRDGGKASVTKG